MTLDDNKTSNENCGHFENGTVTALNMCPTFRVAKWLIQ